MQESASVWRRAGEVLAALGVIGSLAFVALEVRQNTDAVRSATLQALSQQSFELALTGLDNVELRQAIATARESAADVTPEQSELLRWFFSAALRTAENRFRQVQLGILDPTAVNQFGGGATTYRLPAFKAYWAEVAPQYPGDFRAFVDSTLIPKTLEEDGG